MIKDKFNNLNFGVKIILLVVACFLLSYIITFVFIRNIIKDEYIDALLLKSKALTLQAQYASDFVSDMRGVYNIFDEERILRETQAALDGIESSDEKLAKLRETPYYYTIPVVVGWNIGMGRAEELGHEFRVVRTGARNPEREAVGIEIEMLEYLQGKQAEEYHVIDTEINSLRYMRAITLKRECLLCHGSPEHYPPGNGYDPLGIKMEGWTEGETRGAMQIIASLEPIEQSLLFR